MQNKQLVLEMKERDIFEKNGCELEHLGPMLVSVIFPLFFLLSGLLCFCLKSYLAKSCLTDNELFTLVQSNSYGPATGWHLICHTVPSV